MSEIEKLRKKIEAKLRMLEFTSEDTQKTVESNDVKAIDRHGNVLESIIEKTHELKLAIQELRMEEGDDLGEIRKWSEGLETKISKYEAIMRDVKVIATEIRDREEEKREEMKRKRNLEEQIELEKAKIEAQAKFKEEFKGDVQSTNIVGAKLPKLVITKFQGTHLDWVRFWDQFETEIDKANITQVAKFSYLKELLIPSVRASIDGLPFTTEGYERAKSILKSKYGKPSEVVNAHVQRVMSLPIIHGAHPAKVHEFYNKLMSDIQTLETLGKITEINGLVRTTLEKLPGIRADLVRLDDNWQEWGFLELIESLRKWCDRNPIPSYTEDRKPDRTNHRPTRKENAYHTKDEEVKGARPCVYCGAKDHKSTACEKVSELTQRKKILSEKKLCFNCTGARHRASDCTSKITCQHCSAKHHTSICDKKSSSSNPAPTKSTGSVPMLLATGEGTVIYPVAVVTVDGIKCRALLDTGSGSSYASAALISRLAKKPVRSECKRIDMMMCSTTQKIDIYKVEVASVDALFKMAVIMNKVDKGVLLTVPNPRYEEKITNYQHLEGVVMEDQDTKEELPIHLILGASECSRIKTDTKPKIGTQGAPIAELTKLGWVMMSPGKDANLDKTFFTRTSAADYEQLCSLDVLGLRDRPDGDQQTVYEEFQEQLTQNEEGWYETGLLWKQGHGRLPSNEFGSRRRLENLVRKLQREPTLMNKYDEIIQEQLAEGIVERVTNEPEGNVFYIPHKPVVKEAAETTKVRIVFDASARSNEKGPSLNDCLETGPPLQNQLWDVLVRNRFKPIGLAGDLKQAFLQIRIRKEDRDALRFHWMKDLDPSKVEVLRFTRALFGLVQSPFLLAATLKEHLTKLKERFPKEVEEILHSLYVDDMITGGATKEEVSNLKETAIAVFEGARFTLHKWHSNEPELEAKSEPDIDEGQSFAKEQLGVRPEETKLLGLSWNKKEDTLAIAFPNKPEEITKREILRFLASIYDPLGLASPVSLVGKFLYREVCDSHIPWDEKVSDCIGQKWLKFVTSLPERIEVPRSLAPLKEEIEIIDLHAFGDTSGSGTSAAVYAVVYQAKGISSGLVAAKARLAKKNLSIPRLELVSAHMAANLVDNVKAALEGSPVGSVYGWLDSTVALHWIKGGGSYKQFVANRVSKINAKDFITWRHVRTDQNPADLGSRGCKNGKLPESWLKGPEWLTSPDRWPTDLLTEPSRETEAEELAKQNREVFLATVKANDAFDDVLEKHPFWTAIRITAWVKRFIRNCRAKKSERVRGTLTTAETREQVLWWVKREQERYHLSDKFKEDQQRLNLQPNNDGAYECRGRVQGSYPIYLPPRTLLSTKIVEDAHILTMHGGVGLIMSQVRQDYWIPRLRQLAKNVVRRCYGCKKFHVRAFHNPPPGNLPTDRTEGSTPFQVIGVDYAGPITYKISKKKEGKAYFLLFTCSLTRAIHIELLPDQTTGGFIKSFKRFVARRGRPKKIYSDNGKSFVAAAKWLKKVMKDEKVQNHLAHQNVVWQFNLSRAPWWGGQFERLVGVVKQAFYKSVGRAILTWNELEEVILDVEVAVNNRPLSYVEDDVQLPVLTPNIMMYSQPNLLPEEEVDSSEEVDLRKRAKYLRRCKDVLWSRWTREYVRSLRERHNLTHQSKRLSLKVGDVVLITREERNRGKWNIGVVVKLIKGRDGEVRAARLRAGKSFLERAVQQLCPMELSCDRQQVQREQVLNPRAREFTPRRAAAAAREKIKNILQQEEEDD